MSFSGDIASFARKATEANDKITRTATLDLFRGVIMSTPVGDPTHWKSPPPPGYTGGRARGSWQCTVGAPAGGDNDLIDKSGGKTISSMEKRVPPGAGQITFLASNLSYIERLEYGWSVRQAPHGMVRINIDRVQPMVDAAIRKNKV